MSSHTNKHYNSIYMYMHVTSKSNYHPLAEVPSIHMQCANCIYIDAEDLDQ